VYTLKLYTYKPFKYIYIYVCKQEGEEDEEPEIDDEDDDFLDSDDVLHDAEVIALKDQLKFVLSVLEFLSTISGALTKIEEIGRSKSTPGIILMINRYVYIYSYGVFSIDLAVWGHTGRYF
jgi:hypothetical protein